jgi:hypothetical protein
VYVPASVIHTLLELVGTPALQLLGVDQSPPPVFVHDVEQLTAAAADFFTDRDPPNAGDTTTTNAAAATSSRNAHLAHTRPSRTPTLGSVTAAAASPAIAASFVTTACSFQPETT